MMNAEEARKETLQMKEDAFMEKIRFAMNKGRFYASLSHSNWERNWKEYLEEELIKNGYKIIKENDGSVYISWEQK